MPATKSFYVEHEVPGGDLVEFEYEVEADSYEPYVPGKISGPPENCYPPEGGYASADTGSVRRRRTDQKDATWDRVPFSVFLEGLALSQDFRDDPKDRPYGKTSLQKAEAFVDAELFEACEDDRQARYEDAMEAKGDMMREEPWDYGGDY